MVKNSKLTNNQEARSLKKREEKLFITKYGQMSKKRKGGGVLWARLRKMLIGDGPTRKKARYTPFNLKKPIA